MDAALALVTPLDALFDGTNFPVESMVKTETSGLPPKFVTYTNLPEGSMATLDGFVPALEVPPEMNDSAPLVKMPYEKTLLLL